VKSDDLVRKLLEFIPGSSMRSWIRRGADDEGCAGGVKPGMTLSAFAKQYTTTPGQMTAVAERRFRDAEALFETGQNDRANGVVYLCGICIEILLKAQLMKLYPETARSSRSSRWESENARYGA